ncbi:MAG: iron ABC transporter permease [Lachnospiraceae bacterium]|nr:iron ABC transporter permease [Lachnospiraceae bacterium]
MLKSKGATPFYKDFWFWVKVVIFVVFLLFLIYPFSTLVFNSFQSTKAEGFTLYNFNRFFTKKYYYQALGNSLKISLIPTITSVLIGVPLAYLMTRYNIAGKSIWHVIIILSLMCPPFLGAYSWIILFGNAGIVTKWLSGVLGISVPSIYGMGGICMVFTLKLFPYVYLYVSGAMGSIDRSVEESAENLGSGKFRRLLTVTVPVVTPSIAAGALMVFMTALADFGTPGILAGGNFRTLPVLIYNEYLSETGGNANLASAISMIIVIIALLILFVQKWWVARKNFTMSTLRPPEIIQYKGWKRFLVTLPVAIISLIAFIPQIVVIFCSFVKTNYSNFVFSEGFTLEHYLELGRSLTTNIRNSFVYSTAAIIFILILGILMSYVIVRRRGKTGGILDMLMMAPYVIPGSVLGLCYIVAFNNLGTTADGTVIRLTGTGTIIIIAMIIRKMPYTVRSGSAFLMQLEPSVEEASINLGETPMKTFLKVTARLMLPGVLSGAIISWVTCINELSTSIMLYTGKTATMTVASYTNIVRNSVGTAASLASILTVTSGILLLIFFKVSKGRVSIV